MRVKYLDEIETVIKRMALLDIDIDFAWDGELSDPNLIFVPQDIDYEDSGGWGYTTCSGDSLTNAKSSKEWCPALGWGSFLPDTVTDWLYNEVNGFLKEGKIMIAPSKHIGLSKIPGEESENKLQRISNGISVMHTKAEIQALFSLELPYIDKMPIKDVYNFYSDNKDSLILFNSAIKKLLSNSTIDSKEELTFDLINEIKEKVAELRLSDKTLNLRKTLTAIGAAISTFLITFGFKIGLDPSATAIGGAGTAVATLSQISQMFESVGRIRKNPFYAIWKLQKGKCNKNIFRKPIWESPKFLVNKKNIPPYHWLTPPTGGWLIPTMRIPKI